MTEKKNKYCFGASYVLKEVIAEQSHYIDIYFNQKITLMHIPKFD